MGRIVAIAGGDLQTTENMNKYMIMLSKKEKPHLLFIGTASKDAEGYIEKIKIAFSKWGCMVKHLSLTKKTYKETEIDNLLAWADIIYVGGGDTVAMMNTWKKFGVDRKLLSIYQKDTAVLGGISAGAICWFSCGHSDSQSFYFERDWKYIIAEGMLNIYHIAFCPHYNEAGRESFDEMLKGTDMPGLAMDNETAFVEDNGKITYIRSRADAKAYQITYKNGVMDKQELTLETLDYPMEEQ